ncbi:hypothetical protein SHVI106290_04515 [Shewanella violacea]
MPIGLIPKDHTAHDTQCQSMLSLMLSSSSDNTYIRLFIEQNHTLVKLILAKLLNICFKGCILV